MIGHRHDAIGRDAVQNGLARLDRLRGIEVEDRRPIRVLQAGHRVVGDVTHIICMNCSLSEVNKMEAWDGKCPGDAI
jgi:hypothetical protein